MSRYYRCPTGFCKANSKLYKHFQKTSDHNEYHVFFTLICCHCIKAKCLSLPFFYNCAAKSFAIYFRLVIVRCSTMRTNTKVKRQPKKRKRLCICRAFLFFMNRRLRIRAQVKMYSADMNIEIVWMSAKLNRSSKW